MKQIEFKTSKGEFVAIELDPKKYYLPHKGHSYLVTDDTEELFALKPGHWEYLFNVSLCTEEQAKEVVDESVNTGLFAHYVKDVPVNTYCYRTATESLRWLLVSIGVEFKYERIDESMFYKRHSDSMSWGEYLTKEAQSKVWNKQQTYLFKKV